ncbi:MAG: transcription antitermination protein NusB [Patescibacteria group bacterium]
MKKRSDPRHLKRIKLTQSLFSWQFRPKKTPPAEISDIVKHVQKIDNLIEKSAPDRPLEQINKIDLAILRNATFELIIKKGIPPKVVVDEAIELGKQFGSDSSAPFINGALGKLIKIKKIAT